MSDSLSTFLDLLTRTDFLVGGFLGLTGLVVIYFVRTDEGPVLEWGLTLTVAAFLAVSLAVGSRLSLLASLFALAVGGWMARPPGGSARAPFGWILIAAGAITMVLRGGFADIGWRAVLAPIVTILIGAALAAWAKRLPQDVLGIMVAISAFGIWATVPETETARALLGASIPLAVATLPPIRARLGYSGAFALAGLLVWVVATGGEARSASIVGGWACIGAIAVLPLYNPPVVSLVGRKRALTVLIHALMVVVASRVIGLWESGGLALLAVIVLFVGGYWLLSLLPSVRARKTAATEAS
ncbi:MAG TPA: hypothetical protein VI193_08195 [Acidimicrobiia bacterium]